MTNTSEQLPPWAMMWLIAFAIFASLKVLTWVAAGRRRTITIAYFIAWPGLDPHPFLSARRQQAPPSSRLLGPSLRTFLGLALACTATHLLPSHPDLILLVAIPLTLHFGLFDLITCAWRRRGVPVRRVMNGPTSSANLADFWSRWNTAFRDVAHRYVFLPLRRRTNLLVATLATFLVSGLIHDLVISVPSRAGYGLPTAYFLIQGIALLADRRFLHARLRTSRILMWAGVLLPLPLLAHAPFRHNVLIPFAQALSRMLPC